MLHNQQFLSVSFFEIYSAAIFIGMLVVSALLIILGSIRLYFLNRSNKTSYSSDVKGSPKVSIHLPICNEPPNLVLKTIESICSLDYENFELLVISNNTSNESLWKPVEKFILDLDNRFKFIHISEVKGYKAGALNFALDSVCNDADYIFTVDADYVLNCDALNVALGTIQERDVQLLQFPQAYRNVSLETSGIEINYKHYFDCYLSSTTSKILALPTGTLTLINRAVFDEGYLWPTDSITEDASLGVELVNKDMKLAFCNHVIGKGTMPTESEDYGKQFKRWVFGNFQVLAKVWNTSGISLGNKIHLSTLLTAWINLLGFVFILMTVALPLLFLDNTNAEFVLLLGMFNVFLHCLFQLIIYMNIADNNLKKAWNGFLVHLGLIEIGAFYWMNYFISKEKPFVRTNKFLSASSTTNRFYIFPIILFVISALCFTLQNNLVAILIGLFGLQMMQAKFHKDQEIIWSKFNFYKQK